MKPQPPSSPPQLVVYGDRANYIGPYRIRGLLGRGGMATVYLAEHSILGHDVAIKVLGDRLKSAYQHVLAFTEEARMLIALECDHIVRVTDFLPCDGDEAPAYVMEHVRGQSLTQVLRRGRPNLLQSLALASQVADALVAVHASGVVHLDVKPDNVLVSGAADGRLPDELSTKLIDFGIAQRPGSPLHRHDPDLTVGTPAYMAPEQLTNEPVTYAADVFAMGELLYELLSGTHAFDGDTAAIMTAKVQGEPSRLASNLECDRRLKSLVGRCLARHASQRPDMLSVRDTLLQALAHEREALSTAALIRPYRRRTIRLYAAGVAAFVLAGGVLLGALTAKHSDQQRVDPLMPHSSAAARIEPPLPSPATAPAPRSTTVMPPTRIAIERLGGPDPERAPAQPVAEPASTTVHQAEKPRKMRRPRRRRRVSSERATLARAPKARASTPATARRAAVAQLDLPTPQLGPRTAEEPKALRRSEIVAW